MVHKNFQSVRQSRQLITGTFWEWGPDTDGMWWFQPTNNPSEFSIGIYLGEEYVIWVSGDFKKIHNKTPRTKLVLKIGALGPGQVGTRRNEEIFLVTKDLHIYDTRWLFRLDNIFKIWHHKYQSFFFRKLHDKLTLFLGKSWAFRLRTVTDDELLALPGDGVISSFGEKYCQKLGFKRRHPRKFILKNTEIFL